jgi:hypothetical protein
MQLNVDEKKNFEMKVDLDNLPAEHDEKGLKLLGVFLVIFALVFGGVAAMVLIASMVRGEFDEDLLFMAIFAMMGIGQLVLGLTLMFRSKKFRIDRTGVSVEQLGLFGRKFWSEPFSHYKGVLSREQFHSGGRNSPSYTLHIVELAHEEKRKNIQLYASRSEEGFRRIWEDYCRKLGMPALEADGDGYMVRSVEDLDKSVVQLVREGKVDIDFDASKRIPPALAVKLDGDNIVATVIRRKVPAMWGLISAIVPSILVYAGFFMKDGPVALGVAGMVFMLIIIGAVVWPLVARQRMRVSGRGVHVCRVWPWGETAGKRLSTEEIETVKICKKDHTRNEAVWVSGDKESLAMGEGMNRDALAWLRNCILKVLAS